MVAMIWGHSQAHSLKLPQGGVPSQVLPSLHLSFLAHTLVSLYSKCFLSWKQNKGFPTKIHVLTTLSLGACHSSSCGPCPYSPPRDQVYKLASPWAFFHVSFSSHRHPPRCHPLGIISSHCFWHSWEWEFSHENVKTSILPSVGTTETDYTQW